MGGGVETDIDVVRTLPTRTSQEQSTVHQITQLNKRTNEQRKEPDDEGA